MCKCTNEKIPYFNAPVYLENKSQIGKVDDIFGPMTDFVSLRKDMIFNNNYFCVKLSYLCFGNKCPMHYCDYKPLKP